MVEFVVVFGGHVVRLRLIQTYEAKHLIFT